MSAYVDGHKVFRSSAPSNIGPELCEQSRRQERAFWQPTHRRPILATLRRRRATKAEQAKRGRPPDAQECEHLQRLDISQQASQRFMQKLVEQRDNRAFRRNKSRGGMA
jgi:hypothetical protein